MKKDTVSQKKSEVLKSNIFDKAIELFTDRGFENVKISDICEALDISVGSFYYYFPSKEAVLLTYTQQADLAADELADTLEASDISDSERLRLMVVEKVKSFSVVGQKLGNVCMSAFLKHMDDSLMDINRPAYTNFTRVIRRGQETGEFRRDFAPEEATGTLRYIVCGLALQWCCSSDRFDIISEAERQTDQVIGYMKA